MSIHFQLAGQEHLDVILPLMRAYHQFEGIVLTDEQRRAALQPLLDKRNLGSVWLASGEEVYLGYLIICYGYSVEFAGKDAFVDEFFIAASYRRQGIGRRLLSHVQSQLPRLGVKALHLEVARTNKSAQIFYSKLDFQARDRFMLMSYAQCDRDE